jgi:hypothetical protein
VSAKLIKAFEVHLAEISKITLRVKDLAFRVQGATTAEQAVFVIAFFIVQTARIFMTALT